MAEQDIVERLRNGKPELYQAVAELRKWADWYVSCACGNVPDEAAAAYLLIEEFDRIDAALTEERSAYIMAHGVFQTEALRSKNEVDKLTAEIASLRQQLAEAREAIDAVWVCSFVIESSVRRGDGPAQYAQVVEALDLVKNFRALSHPDREGERG